MSTARFTVAFRGDLPDPLKVGDELWLAGRVTVKAISADLVDVTAIGQDCKYLLGDVGVDLYANALTVEAA